MHQIRANLSAQGTTRRAKHDGAEHLIVPAVLIVEGVLNGALVTQAEFGKYVDSWNGIPVPVLHPEERGASVPANRPDIIERTIGRVYNARVDGNKLKAELWLNVEKAERLGHTALIAQLEAGEVVELSTAYYSDGPEKHGEFNGVPYTNTHTNIRPEHLALLPGETGACSVADGCGTRVNSAETNKGVLVNIKQAIAVLAQATGLREDDLRPDGLHHNCKCDNLGGYMPELLKKQAEALKANAKLTPKQFDMLMGLDPEQVAMVEALMASVKAAPEGAPAPAEGEDEVIAAAEGEGEGAEGLDEEGNPLNANGKTPTPEQIGVFVANEVARQTRIAAVVGKLVANEACAFNEKELRTMSVQHLETYEKSIRPADYSGQGAFSSNATIEPEGGQALAPRGFIYNRDKAAK